MTLIAAHMHSFVKMRNVIVSMHNVHAYTRAHDHKRSARFVDPDCYYPSCTRRRHLKKPDWLHRNHSCRESLANDQENHGGITRFNAPLSRPEPSFPRICSLESPLWGWLPTWLAFIWLMKIRGVVISPRSGY